MSEPTKQITLKLEPAVLREIEQAARVEHRSVSGQLRHLISTAMQQRSQPVGEAA